MVAADYRLKWLGSASAKAVSVSGDWNNWSTTAGVFAMARDDDGVFAANIFLPERCPRKNLIMAGVCCYRYKFYIEFGTRRRWQHDPRQPMDKDPDGWVNNFMCKYANGHDGKPMRTIPHASRAYARQAEAGNSASGPLLRRWRHRRCREGRRREACRCTGRRARQAHWQAAAAATAAVGGLPRAPSHLFQWEHPGHSLDPWTRRVL